MSCQLYPDPHRSKPEISTFLLKEADAHTLRLGRMNEFYDKAVLRYGIVFRRDKRE